MSTTAETNSLQEELDVFDARFLRTVRERLRAYEEQLQRALDEGNNDRGIYATMVNVRAALEYVAARELQLPALARDLSATLFGWPAGLAGGVPGAQNDAVADASDDDDDMPALADVDGLRALLEASDSSADGDDDDDEGIRALIADGLLQPVVIVDGQVAVVAAQSNEDEDGDDLPPLVDVSDSSEEESEDGVSGDDEADDGDEGDDLPPGAERARSF